MFAMRWHDLYGMCVRRRRPLGAVATEFTWWRVSSYYDLQRESAAAAR